MSGSQIGSMAGLFIGGALAAPTGGMSIMMGASLGMTAGSILGGYIDPIRMRGPRLTDQQGQTNTTGGIIPYGYGTIVTEGNVIWSAPLKEHKHKDNGKGGQENISYTYTRSYAIGICQGPITGLLWIKRNGKLVYSKDIRLLERMSDEDLHFLLYFEEKIKIYLGTQTQNPDDTILAVEGMGNVSAYRDLAYIVIKDDDLTQTAGAISQYTFCVLASPEETYFTTHPYPQDMAVESINAHGQSISNGILYTSRAQTGDSLRIHSGIVSGALDVALTSCNAPPESLSIAAPSIASGELRTQNEKITHVYGEITMQPASILAGGLVHGRNAISIPTEGIQIQPTTIVSGNLQ